MSPRDPQRLPEEIRSFLDDLAPGGRIDRCWKLRESLDSEEQTLLTLRLEQDKPWDEVAEIMRAGGDPATTDALRERFERLMMKLQRLARE